ncbi:MAG: DMT family transporter, partial [Alphaproteobacteria bacterium]|nr:DMT family transporter [Alphaproteobacteria bacterium]
MNEENNSKGIILVLVSMALFSFQDALIKFVFEKAALYEIYFGRVFIASIILGTYLFIKKQKIKLKTEYPFLTAIRVLLHFFAFSFFFISLTYMSLAMANALFFSSPFFISIFAKFFLNEQIGIRRWSAIFLGFIGIYIVLNPDFSEF